MSEQVMAAPQPAPAQTRAPQPTRLLQRKSAVGLGQEHDEEGEDATLRAERPRMQRKASRPSALDAVPPIVDDVLAESGEPLDLQTRIVMEQRFGHDFSRVRIHTDSQAAASAEAVNAVAYTVGRDVVFGTGQYAPESADGKRLLAHELTHVVQQRAADNAAAVRQPLKIGPEHDAYEREASAWEASSVAGRAASGTSGASVSAAAPAVQRVSLWQKFIRLIGFEGSFEDDELQAYLDSLADNRKIEDNYDSDNKAREIVRRWQKSNPSYQLNNGHRSKKSALSSAQLKALLVKEMYTGVLTQGDKDGIKAILTNSTKAELLAIVDPKQGGIAAADLGWLQKEDPNTHARIFAVMAQPDQPPEPARPAIVQPQKVKFKDLPDKQLVSDPTGRKHGIQIERRGDELFYFLPNDKTPRQVPRPLKTDEKKVTKPHILSVQWGGIPLFQTAFEVHYGESEDDVLSMLELPYVVNVNGLGSYADFVQALAGQPGSLEVQPAGLEYERAPDIIAPRRPKAERGDDIVRYHMPGVSFSMYIHPDRSIKVVDDGKGSVLWTAGASTVRNVQVTPSGDVTITRSEKKAGVVTVTFSLRGPKFTPNTTAQAAQPAEREALLKQIRGLGIVVNEKGAELSLDELKAAWDVLQRWRGNVSVVDALKAQNLPGLTIEKDVLNTEASFNDENGLVKVRGYLAETPEEQRLAITHELTHAMYHAAGLKWTGTTAPADVTEEATKLHDLARAGAIDEDIVREGGPRKPRTEEQWEKTLSTDKELNDLWGQLHRRFPIGDPEQTSDIRGLDVADESRYSASNRGDVVGHGFGNVTEFMASFVTSSTFYQKQMLDTVKKAKDPLLAHLYRQLWNWVNTHLVSLGTTNPY